MENDGLDQVCLISSWREKHLVTRANEKKMGAWHIYLNHGYATFEYCSDEEVRNQAQDRHLSLLEQRN